ncbi:MAG: hypothetical protein AVDCRST_MAG59-3840, partial [uncultured Thermomicrobiales bacterium]
GSASVCAAHRGCGGRPLRRGDGRWPRRAGAGGGGPRRAGAAGGDSDDHRRGVSAHPADCRRRLDPRHAGESARGGRHRRRHHAVAARRDHRGPLGRRRDTDRGAAGLGLRVDLRRRALGAGRDVGPGGRALDGGRLGGLQPGAVGAIGADGERGRRHAARAADRERRRRCDDAGIRFRRSGGAACRRAPDLEGDERRQATAPHDRRPAAGGNDPGAVPGGAGGDDERTAADGRERAGGTVDRRRLLDAVNRAVALPGARPGGWDLRSGLLLPRRRDGGAARDAGDGPGVFGRV